jgi:hypothetical protein
MTQAAQSTPPRGTGALERALRLLMLASALLGASAARADSWLRAESSNFLIYSNVEASATRRYLEQLEAFKYLTERMMGADPSSPTASAKFTIYLLESQDDLKIVRPHLSKYAGGFYSYCVEGAQAYVFRPMSYGIGQPDQGITFVLHEYAHHLMFSRMRRFYPSWYVEGFAEYMSTVTLQRGSYIVGAANPLRVPQLTGEHSWLDYKVMLDPALFSEALKQRKVDAFKFYAQAWLLTHYMLSDSGRTQAFNDYFERIGRGEPGLKSFESATGIPPDKLRALQRAHLRKLPALRVTVPDLPETAVTITRMPKEQDDYFLLASALHCSDKWLGEQITAQLRALRPKFARDTRFRTELARAELLFGDGKAAHKELEALALLGGSEFEINYLLGRSYYDQAAQGGDGASVLQAKSAALLLEAYKLNKRHPPTLYYLAKSLDTDDEPGKATVNAANGAAILGPSIYEYAYQAAALNLRKGDRDFAIRVLQPFASDPHRSINAARVTAIIKALDEGLDWREALAAQPRVEEAALEPDAPQPESPDQESAEPEAP